MNISKTGATCSRLRGYSYVFAQPPWRFRHARPHPFSAATHYGARRPSDSRRRKNFLSDDKFEVNLEEQEIGRGDRKRRRLTQDDVQREMAEDEQLDDEIVDLEKSIRSLKIPDEMPDSIKNQMFSEEELQRMEESGSIDDQDIHPYRIIPQHPIPMQAQLHLNKLNEALDDADVENAQHHKHQHSIWRWYSRSKTNVPALLHMIPKDAWSLIWKSQALEAPSNPDRAEHLATLAQDKKFAGWHLSLEEQFAHIEGLFMAGDQREALSLFEQTLVGENVKNPRLLEMGVRMYAHHGNPERAHSLVQRLFEVDGNSEPRILTALISAYASRRNDESVFTAWSLYQDLQRRLSSDMRMPEYDAVVLAFLDSGHKDFALAVFRDMMLRGESGNQFAKSFSKLSQIIGLTGSPMETNDISLDAIRYLPRRFQNKWFYASWLRKLISEGQVNGAAQVVELMYERNVKPDAKHMNGIISAWLRDQRTHPQHRAEELGWTMIQRRIDMVQERWASMPQTRAASEIARGPASELTSSQTETSTAPAVADSGQLSDVDPVNVTSHTRLSIPVNVSRPVPPATIETFCVLLQYYLRRGLHTHIAHLRSLLRPADLRMNSFFMNHLLYATLRTRGHRAAWDTFLSLSDAVKPDLETWQCLWQCAKNHVHDVRNVRLTGFPMPRELFGKMLAWWHDLGDRDKAMTMAEVKEDEMFMLEVIRAFCLAHDLEGSFVAVHTFDAKFGLTPNESVMRTVLTMLTKLLPPHLAAQQKRRFPRRQRRSRKYGANMEREMVEATYLLDTVRKERLNALADLGVDSEDFSEEMRRRENLGICLQMLVRVMEERRGRAAGGGRPFEDHAIQRAAEECGVEGVDVEAALKVTI